MKNKKSNPFFEVSLFELIERKEKEKMTLEKLLKEMASGRIFSAEFIKKDGSRRKIIARCGVKKGNKGIGLSFNPIEKGLIPCLDIELSRKVDDINKAKRFININSLIWVIVNNKKYFINDLIIDESTKKIDELNKIISK
mgnify:CR=1 FL=1